MICKKCNHEYPDEMEVCPICGEPRPEIAETSDTSSSGSAGAYGAAAGPPPQQNNWTTNTAAASVPAVQQQRTAEQKGGVTPLVLGILSLLIPYVGIVLGILAIVFGNTARKTNPRGSADAALGQAGWVLGIIGLVCQAILVVYLAFAFSMIFSLMDYVGDIANYGHYGGYSNYPYSWFS